MPGRTTGSKNKVLHIWTEEEKKYLANITPGHHYKEIQELMNKKFDLKLTLGQIKGAIGRYNLNTGFTGQFKKGDKAWNKGKKGIYSKGSEKTWFKKGRIPPNHRKVGSERINAYGYIEVKVAESDKWRLKHQLVWEKYHGPIPQGNVIIFADRNKQNLDIDNLILVSNKQLLILNQNNLIKNDTQLTKTGVIIADLYGKINELKNKNKNKK